MDTIGKRIAENRKRKNLKQDELAEMLGVSAQAVSKWENDLSCPDISLLPQISEIFGISLDELIGGKKEKSTVLITPEEERKDIDKMILRVIVDSAQGDKVRINLPMKLVKVAAELGMAMPQFTENDALKDIDLAQIIAMAECGVSGNLVEVESAEGDKVNIFIE